MLTDNTSPTRFRYRNGGRDFAALFTMVILICIGAILLNRVINGSDEHLAVGLIALLLAFILFVFQEKFYTIFIAIALVTEFYYIHISGGVLRPYHFFSILIIFCLLRHTHKLTGSSVLRSIAIFVIVNLIAVLASDDPSSAINSLLSLFANIAVAVATALILISKKTSYHELKNVILYVTVISIVWGLCQISVFRLTGNVLALSPEQVVQIKMGLTPVFRTEADTFGKFMVLPFMLLLPNFINNKGYRFINLIYFLFIIGILINFIRTPIYGTLVILPGIIWWYYREGKFYLLKRKLGLLAVIIFLFVFALVKGFVPASDYARHKIDNLFNQQEIVAGSSSKYRIESMDLVVKRSLSGLKYFLIGNGWGQTYFQLRGVEVQTGGGDIINVLGYSGLFGVLSYLSIIFYSFRSSMKIALEKKYSTLKYFSEGVMFALAGVFCSAQMSGYLITPEFWILLGFCIYLSALENKASFPTCY